MEKLKESMENVPVYGKNIKELWGKLDLNSSSLKTAQCSLFEDLNKSFAILPKAGMIVNGNVYRLHNLVSIIRENEFTVLPTPSKSDAKIILRSSAQYKKYYMRGHQDKALYQFQLFNGKSSYDNVRMDDGFSRELDKRRIEDMGNAVIPLIAYYLFECIKKFRESI